MRKLFILFCVLPLLCSAQKNYPQLLEHYMQAQASVNGFSGTVLVMKQNKPLLNAAYGSADREWNIPNTPSTKFRIGSITKQFTAACILQLIEQGKLGLDDKLTKFIPGFLRGDSVTIRMLLNHTSGIPSYTSMPDFEKVARLSFDKDSILKYMQSKPYNFNPGEKFLYNNSGFFLLGYILEKVSGMSYTEYLRKNILDKTGMSNSGTDRLDSILPMRARGYTKSKKQFQNAPFISMEWPFSAGVMYSTTEDLYKWDRALYGNTLLTNASKQKMFTPGKGNYGFGVFVDTLDNHYRISHGGSIPGFSSKIDRFVNDDICLVLLSNNESDVDIISAALASILFDEPVELPYEHKAVKLDTALLSRYTGKYTAFLTIVVIKKEGKLYRHREGTADIELIPESESKFFYGDGSDRQLEFELDKSGKVVKIWFINNGQKGEMKKAE